MKRNVMRTMSLAFAGIMAAGALTACGGSNTAAPAESRQAQREKAHLRKLLLNLAKRRF